MQEELHESGDGKGGPVEWKETQVGGEEVSKEEKKENRLGGSINWKGVTN